MSNRSYLICEAHKVLQASDAPSTTLLVEAILNILYEGKDYPRVLESLTVLSKKHGQFKTSVTSMVDLVMKWLPEIKQEQGIKTWLEWVGVVRSVTEGKVCIFMFVLSAGR